MRRLAAALAASFALVAAPAAAQDPVNVPWERVLPPAPASTDVQPHAIPNCSDGSLACVRRVERKLRRQWTVLDAACDHRAIAALAYLRITELIRKDLERKRSRWFRHKRWFAYVVTDFSNSYFDAFERYERGEPVPEPWRIFYDNAMHGETNAVQDLLLFSNAHAQHDLPLTYGSMGVRAPGGASHKPDHDGVNEVNVRVIPRVKREIEQRYDPSFRDVPGPLDEMGGLEPTKSWREGAWRNGERLVNAASDAEREQIRSQIVANATTWATMISTPQRPGTRAERDAHCRAFPR
jgi:Family of unknown function (DUF5995)